MQNKINYRLLNIEIFEDTAERCRTNERLRKSIAQSRLFQKFTGESENIPSVHQSVFADCAKIVVSQKRTLEAALAYTGSKVAVLNFASASNPGGGVTTGAGAQEECICRCSTLFSCLTDKKMCELFYEPHRRQKNSLHNDDCIYTPGVTVFKTDDAVPELLDESDWYDVDVITCAAPNLRFGDVVISNDALKQLHKKRLRRILDIAISNGVENIVLGAFGCGAFKNDPKIVSDAVAETLEDYLFAFKTIEFAVFCRPGFERNYREFCRLQDGA